MAVMAAIATVTRAFCQLSGGRTLDELDLLDRIITVARGRRHLDLVADRAADKRPTERRIVGDAPHPRVRFRLAYDLVGDRLVVLVRQGDGRAQHHPGAGK